MVANQNQVLDLGKPTTTVTVAAARDSQKNAPFKQPSIMNDEEQVEVPVRQSDGAAEGWIADGAQHLGALLDAMIEAGVSADGGSKTELGSVMTMAVLSDGELTQCGVASEM